jgi:nucleotide-binding universal stress UspA family protein
VIVVGVDGSPAARRALAFAADEARLRGKPLRIVCAWETPALEFVGAAFVPAAELWQEAERGAEELAAAAVRELAVEGIAVEGVAVEGHPARVLAEQAQDAELLVVGSRGRGSFAGLVLGSVSHALAHLARCPLVIVPAEHA